MSECAYQNRQTMQLCLEKIKIKQLKIEQLDVDG